MRARDWRLLGLGLGIALGVAVLLADAGAIERIVTGIGLDRVTPYAQPPLGHTARLVLALAMVIAGLAVGWAAGLLLARSAETEPEPEEAFSPAPAVVSDEARSLDTLGWRTPPGVAVVPDQPAEARAEPAPPIAAVPDSTAIATPDPVLPVEPPAASPVYEERPLAAAVADPITPEVEAAMPDFSPALARIEAMVAELSRHGPQGFDSRFEAIDGRLQQMAQQMAELSSLARAQQRTPAMTPSVTRLPQPPADPAQRRALGQAARDLRARLGDAEFA